MTTAPIKMVRGFGVLGSWLLPVMIAVLFLVVLLRYVFNIGWIGLQESVLWLHAAAFLFTAAWTLADDAHVRVDVFYHRFSRRGQRRVNLLGTLCCCCLLPVFCCMPACPMCCARGRSVRPVSRPVVCRQFIC